MHDDTYRVAKRFYHKIKTLNLNYNIIKKTGFCKLFNNERHDIVEV